MLALSTEPAIIKVVKEIEPIVKGLSVINLWLRFSGPLFSADG